MADCTYKIDGNIVTEQELKEMLIGDESGGLLDALINNGSIEKMKGFPIIAPAIIDEITSKSIPAVKLKEILEKEVSSRKGYPLNMLSALELNAEGTDFKIPLWSSPYADKFESLLTAIVNKAVVKQKFNGHSYVLGSEEGFKVKEGDEAKEAIDIMRRDNSIVFTDSYDPEIGLQYMRFDDKGNMLPAQIMLPFNFKNKDKFGNKLKLKDFMIPGTNKLDISKMDEKVLKIFGFRIPTQGHNSMMSVEIVGFLPEEQGDLILAPKDFTVQTGWDFDVDKLYTYMYNVQYKNGKLTTEFENTLENTAEIKQNNILDIHHSVMENPEMAKLILAPESFGDLKDIVKEVSAARKSTITTLLSDSFQRKAYISGVAGKTGVGNFSLDSTFNTVIQDKDLKYETKKDEPDFQVRIGDRVTTGDLSNPYTLASQAIIKRANGIENLSKEQVKNLKYKSSVIQALQSAAVDNANEQILDKVNINDQTFDVVRAMAQLGFEERDLSALLVQDIIWQYVEFTKSGASSLKDYSDSSKEAFLAEMIEKYDPENVYETLSEERKEELASTTTKVLMEAINTDQLTESKISTDNNIRQIALLERFIVLSNVGAAIKSVQSAINTESSGLSKTLLENSAKLDQISSLGSSSIVNAQALLGTFDTSGKLETPTTINGFAVMYGAMFADDIYKKYFPYSRSGFIIQSDELLKHIEGSKNTSHSKKALLKKEIFDNMRAYMFTNPATNLFEDSVQAEQQRIFMDNGDQNQSLATILNTLKDKTWYKTNAFLNKLMLKPVQNGFVSKVEFEAAVGENYDESQIYIDFAVLFGGTRILGTFNGIEYSAATLAQDLVNYALLEGGSQGAKQFLKYIPTEYLKLQGFGSGLASMRDFNYGATFDGKISDKFIYTNPSGFTRQFFQNNPSKAHSIQDGDIKNKQAIYKMDTFKPSEAFEENNQIEYSKQNGDIGKTLPQFVSIQNSDLKSKYALYEYSSEEGVYKRLQVVSGSYGFKQYDYTGEITKPVQKANEIVNKQVINTKAATGVTRDFDTAKTNSNMVPINNPINKLNVFDINNKLSGVALIKDLLLQIENNPALSTYNRALATDYMAMEYPTGIKVTFDSVGLGSYNTATNTFKLNIEAANNTTQTEVAEAILHELSHVHTVAAFIKFDKDPNSVTPGQRAALNKLKGLRSKYERHLKLEGKGAAYNAFVIKLETWKATTDKNNIPDGKQFTPEELSEFYGAYNLKEFISMAQTDSKFQEILNNVKDSDSKSFLDKVTAELKNIIMEFLRAISGRLISKGIELRTDTLLAPALFEINALITDVQNELKTQLVSEEKESSTEREYTPENITSLKDNEVFVFGANTAGGHGGGTAGLAQRGTTSSNYKALPVGTKGKWSEYGIVDKLMQGTEGKSFGIVTKAASINGTSLTIGRKRSVLLSRIEESINALIQEANNNPGLKFLVTKFGTNMAGFKEQEMKSLLENKNLPDNIILPKEFEVRNANSTNSQSEPVSTQKQNQSIDDLKSIEPFYANYTNEQIQEFIEQIETNNTLPDTISTTPEKLKKDIKILLDKAIKELENIPNGKNDYIIGFHGGKTFDKPNRNKQYTGEFRNPDSKRIAESMGARYEGQMLFYTEDLDDSDDSDGGFSYENAINNSAGYAIRYGDSNPSIQAYLIPKNYADFANRGVGEVGVTYDDIENNKIRKIGSVDFTRSKDLNSPETIAEFKKFVGENNSSTLRQNNKPTGTINVYWGQQESSTSTRILSNLAPRKFTYQGKEYGSVEHAYQSLKSGGFDEDTYEKYVSVGGYGTKIRGKGSVAELIKADSLGLMKDLVVESFLQNKNSEAAKKLLEYNNFTHNTNQLIDKAFLEGLKLAQKELLKTNSQSSKPVFAAKVKPTVVQQQANLSKAQSDKTVFANLFEEYKSLGGTMSESYFNDLPLDRKENMIKDKKPTVVQQQANLSKAQLSMMNDVSDDVVDLGDNDVEAFNRLMGDDFSGDDFNNIDLLPISKSELDSLPSSERLKEFKRICK